MEQQVVPPADHDDLERDLDRPGLAMRIDRGQGQALEEVRARSRGRESCSALGKLIPDAAAGIPDGGWPPDMPLLDGGARGGRRSTHRAARASRGGRDALPVAPLGLPEDASVVLLGVSPKALADAGATRASAASSGVGGRPPMPGAAVVDVAFELDDRRPETDVEDCGWVADNEPVELGVLAG